MSEDSEDVAQLLESALSAARELPAKALILYARLWSLELWLRRMVYVELKSAFGDQWTSKLSTNGAARSQKADARLTHMPTAERDLLSYSTFGDLCQTI